ncbi:MAG: gliding motility-associated C-terminal domain-containing protein [Bacteroidota bacterium]
MRNFYRYFLFVGLGLCFVQSQMSAQCPLTVSAGPDKVVCASGQTAVLEGSITGPEIGFRWTPATGLNDQNLLMPTATVTAMQTYTLTAAAEDPSAPNLVTNPGFESGNTGFTSQYTYSAQPITPGTYVLTTSPSLVLSNFPPCDDHTYGNGTGNMMLINGNGGANSQVWCQTIPVMANSWYVMSAWAAVSPISPPVFQFAVNNTPVGAQAALGFQGCTWQEFSATWFSGSATSATLCIRDVSGSGNGLFGDDYGLDDIFFAKACTVTDNMKVSIVTVNAVLASSIVLGCNSEQSGIILNGSASTSGPGIVYAWSGPGILSGGDTPNAIVNEPGAYTLTVSYDTGNGICSKSATINVLPDPHRVQAEAVANDLITCLNKTSTLDGAGSTTGPTISYSWTPTSSIVSGATTLTPVVNAAGAYTLLVTNSLGGCTATATANVGQDLVAPLAVTTASGTLPCSGGTFTLNGNGSSVGPDFSYQWSGPGIVSGDMTLNNCIVNAPGIYKLVVTNDSNGCTDDATTNVTQNGVAPITLAAANAPGALNCITPTLTLNSNGSSTGPNFTYAWTTANGHLVGAVNGTSATVDTTGTYKLVITNTSTGCTGSATVVVTGQFTKPSVAVANPVPMLTCVVDSVRINAGASSTGPNFNYQWTTTNGHILSGATTLKPWVDTIGTYRLVITNASNGCTSTTSVKIAADTVKPTVIAAADLPGVLNCKTALLSLNSHGSSNDSTMAFQWTTPNGHFVGTVTDSTALIDSVGLYVLTIRDTTNGCISKDSVTINGQFTLPSIQIASPVASLTCAADSVQINANGSSTGVNFAYQWNTTNGNILSGNTTLTPWVNAAGNYALTITDASNGCTATQTSTVGIDTLSPTVNINLPTTLDCQTTQINLNASGSPATITPSWTFVPTPGGSGTGIVSGQNSLTPTVNAPGTYTLHVSNTTNGCQNAATVLVTQNISLPVAEAGPAPVVDCTASLAALDGTGSAQGPGISYLWSNSASTLQTTVNLPGTYYLSVTNSANHCAAVDSVLVASFGGVPNVAVAAAPMITCTVSQVALSATASVGPEFAYQWNFTGAGIGVVSGDTSLAPLVASAGTYTLVVTNTQTGCTNSDAVIVTQSAGVPTAEAGSVQTLVCGVTQVTLDGSMSSSSQDIIYNWSSGTGNIVSGANSLMPVVNAAGTYTLVVTDTLNGCSATDQVIVQQDSNAPNANAGVGPLFTCLTPQLTLNGAGSTLGASINYLWTTTDGQIVSGANTLSPQISAPGTYMLEVTNTLNNCKSNASVTITDARVTPTALAQATQALTCAQQQTTLSGTGSSSGANFKYLWNGPGLVSGGNTLSPTVNAAGLYTITVTDQSNGCTATASATVLSNTTLPTAAVAVPQNLDCATTQVTLNGSGSSTGANFTYIWAGPGIVSGGTTLNPLVNAAGVYTVTVTNQTNGCSATANATVQAVATPPTALAAAPQSLSCALQQVNLSGAGSSSGPGFSYIWTGPGLVSGTTTLTPTVNAAGNYILKVTNAANGCTATASVTVSGDVTVPQAFASAPGTLNCVQIDLTLSGLGSSSGPNIIYAWSGPGIVSGGNGLSPLVDALGDYVLTVTNQLNGCSSTATATVLGNFNLPTASASVVQTLTCIQLQIALSGTGSSTGTNFSYDWSGPGLVSGANTLAPQVNAAGTYTLKVSDQSNSCSATATVTVVANTTPPQAVATAPQPLTCNVPQAALSGAGSSFGPNFRYNWAGPGIVNGYTSLSPIANVAGTYTMTVTNQTNGCTAIATANLLSNTTPPNAEAGPDQNLPCNTPTTTLQGSSSTAGVSFQWSTLNGHILNGQNTASPTVDSSGAYTLLVTNPANGCTSTSEVIVNKPIAIFPQRSITSPDCIPNTGGIAFLGGVGPYKYSIDGGVTLGSDSLFTGLDAGVYQTFVQDANGCTETAAVTLPAVLIPKITLDSIVNLKAGESYNLAPTLNLPNNQISQIQWMPSTGLSCTDCLNPIATPTTNMVYTLRVVSINGCPDFAAIGLRIKGEVGIYIPNSFAPEAAGENSQFRIYTERVIDNFNMQIFDRWGSLLFESKDPAIGWDGMAKGKPQNPGVYVYAIQFEVTGTDGAKEKKTFLGDVLLWR